MNNLTKKFNLSCIASAVAITFVLPAHASVVRSDVNYQYFRDFAENKGQFTVGASNIDIKDVNGHSVGTMLNNIPMIDFSSISRDGGFSTLIAPQYLLSVAHNQGYKTVQFGPAGTNPDANYYTYNLVDRNEYEKTENGLNWDYHAPRLNKLVTEVAPANVSNAGISSLTYADTQRFPIFVRAGSGVQNTRDKEGKNTHISNAYRYLTGGTTLKLHRANEQGWLNYWGSLYDAIYGPLTTYGTPGDSGSAAFAYDTQEKRWVLVSVMNSYSGMDKDFNRASIVRKDFNEARFAEDVAGTINNNTHNATFHWTAKGASSNLNQVNGRENLVVNLADRSITDNSSYPTGASGAIQKVLPQDDHGKSLNFNGNDATIILKQNIDQGAGALNFNANVTVRPEVDQTWLGAGITVAKDKQVNWLVKNPQGDRLSKLGEGTLHVNGRGKNLGDISVGDGTVILNQQLANGQKQAFNQVNIVSGRPTVVLNSADQVNPNNIYFGFRGGRLDLNGNSLTFKRIRNIDDGARIVNNGQSAATLTIAPAKAGAEDLSWGTWRVGGSDIYEYINTHRNKRTDYFRLIGNPETFFPINGISNEHWQFLSHNKDEAVQMVLVEKNKQPIYNTFNGFIGEADKTKHNGKLNVVYDPQSSATPATESSIRFSSTRTTGSDIYQFTNRKDGVRDYFVLKGNPRKAVPTDRQSNEDWEYLTTNRQEAINIVLERKNKGIELEKLNTLYTINGGLNLNGDLTAKGGKLLLSGRPTPHAYDLNANKDVVYEDDWQNRSFNANNINVSKEAQLYIGRNVSNVRANFSATNNAQLNLGYVQNNTPSCYYSEFSGKTNCDLVSTISAKTFDSLPVTQITGNVTLANSSQMTLGKASLTGTVQAATTTQIRLADQANWTLTGDSRIGSLNAEQGSTITLNNQAIPSRFNKLIIDGNLNGVVKFNYATNLANTQADHIEVNGIAKGVVTLAIKNSGKEPDTVGLSLLTLKNSEQSNHQVNVGLENGYVDLGAYRYVLANRNHDYRLYNPLKDTMNRQSSVTATTQYNNAIAEAEKHRQELARLTAEAEKHRQAEQTAKQNVTAAQEQLNQATIELNRIQQHARFYQHYYPSHYQQIQGQLDAVKLKVTDATNKLTEANNTAKSTADLLKAAEQAVNSAKIIANQAEEKLASLNPNTGSTTVVDLKGEMLKLCQENGANCDLIQISDQSARVDVNQADWVSHYANTALSELSAQANSALQIGNGLERQLFTHSDKLRVWSSLEHQKTEHKSNLYRPYEQQTNLTQVGVEMPLANGFSAGAVVSKNHANAEFDEGVTGKSNLLMATLYGKWQSSNGTFVSLDGSYGKAKNRINLFGDNRFTRHISAVGANIGHDFNLAGVKLQPSVGARYYRLSGKQYNLGEVEVNSPTANFMSYQAGVKVSKAFELADWKVEPSLATHYVDANSKRLAVSVNGENFEQRFGRYLKTEAGIAVERNQWQLELNAGFLKGNEIQKQRFAGVKMQYSW